MPYYGYECKTCGKFDLRKPVEQRDDAVCPQCGATALRLPSNYSFKMKI